MPAQPLVSVVMPVFNGADLVGRALESLRRQSLAEWEALAVNDGSTDGTTAVLDKWAAADPRIRVFHHPENRGLSAARNTALAHAQAEMVAYLDHDDEFYPDHLARVHAVRGSGDVLLFHYDLIEERPGHPDIGKGYTHDPAACFHAMNTTSIAVPLGVAHRRALLAKSGYFDESLGRYQGQDEDADLWRRFVQAGAKFAAVQAKSGLYHIRGDSLVRRRPPAPGASTATHPVDVVRGTEKHTLVMPSTDAWIVDQIFRDGEYAGLPLKKLNRPPVVLDVGAHCGTFALFAKLTIHRDAVVHCFEPYPPHVELLTKNLAAFPGVTVHGFGLGSADATADLLLDPKWGVGHSTIPALVPSPVGRVPVTIRDAAAVWDDLGLTEVDVLKLDAEGAEADILDRLDPRLERVRAVLVEYHTQADRRRIDALLPGHALIGAVIHDARVGTLKYLRADLAGGAA